MSCRLPARGEITARHACNGPRPVSVGRASFYQAIVVGQAGAGLPAEWTNPGQCTPSPAARRFTSHTPLEDTDTSLPVSPRPTKNTITDGSLSERLRYSKFAGSDIPALIHRRRINESGSLIRSGTRQRQLHHTMGLPCGPSRRNPPGRRDRMLASRPRRGHSREERRPRHRFVKPHTRQFRDDPAEVCDQWTKSLGCVRASFASRR